MFSDWLSFGGSCQLKAWYENLPLILKKKTRDHKIISQKIYHGAFIIYLFYQVSSRCCSIHCSFMHHRLNVCTVGSPQGKKSAAWCSCVTVGTRLRLVALLTYSSASFACVTYSLHWKSAALMENMVGKNRIALIPESSLPPHRDSHNSRSEVEWIRQRKKKKKKKVTPHPKGVYCFFFKSRFQAQTPNVAWSGPSYEFIASVSMVIEPDLKRVTFVTQELWL